VTHLLVTHLLGPCTHPGRPRSEHRVQLNERSRYCSWVATQSPWLFLSVDVPWGSAAPQDPASPSRKGEFQYPPLASVLGSKWGWDPFSGAWRWHGTACVCMGMSSSSCSAPDHAKNVPGKKKQPGRCWAMVEASARGDVAVGLRD